MDGILRKVRLLLQMVKFEHTIFALPFAMISMLLAARELPHWLPSGRVIFWILIAMVGARSTAMAFNRLADANIDKENPRTATRHIPAGILSRSQVLLFLVFALGLFEIAAWQLNPLCLLLSPIALVFLLGYSYTKRFTSLCHLVLGTAIGLAPLGAWIAVRGELNPLPVFLGLVVMLWIGGFDIIYALQDYEFDSQDPRLFSLPKRIGKANALRVSRLMHLLMLCLLVYIGIGFGLHFWYFAGVAVVTCLIAWEQSLVKPDDLSKVNLAFFTLNGWVSVSLFVFVVLDRWLMR
ncbi:MAG: putative 4-hydroxybenzoate polyprenyltransferase [Armatimonadetes bacterium]|nr:putative 4-hydroxybenzoate polyprenyltransferase [Armatimonadota bacterium]